LRRDVVRPWAGEDLVLPCVAQGHQRPHVSWYRVEAHGQRVSVGSNLRGSGLRGRVRMVQGQLVISDLQEADSGSYVCVANNSLGEDSYTVEVSVRGRLSVSVTPTSSRINLGQSITFTCQVGGYPVESVNWYKDGRLLQAMPRLALYDRTLHITQMRREDAGIYQCMAGNKEDAAQG
ncbi:unnamed protein product, partial [Meganyctiphanes norvegica]